MKPPVLIMTAASLAALRKRSSRRGIDRITLGALPMDAEAQRAERHINAGLSACGCIEGSVAVALGMIACAAYYLSPGHSIDTVRQVLVIVGALFACALVGKVTGLAIAELRLQRAIRLVLRESLASW